MIREFEQYRFARIEGRNVTRARLQTQFKDGINDLDELENAISLDLRAMAEVGNRANRLCEEMRLAIHEFFGELRRQIPGADRHRSAG